jgi:sugar/nucleoside kinase (ribokinase family)
MIVSLGDAVVDLVAGGLETLPAWGQDREVDHITPHRGGAGLNVAVNLATLGNPTTLVAGVGNDEWGTFLREGLTEKGVDGRGVRPIAAPTAVTMVLTGAQDRAFVSVYGATAAFRAEDIDPKVITQATHIHLSGYWQSRALAAHLPSLCDTWKAQGITISLDVGYDATQQWQGGIREMLPLVDIFFPNEEEACGITGESDWHQALVQLAKVVPWVAIKRGASGATLRWGILEITQPAYPANVVDTTGAGDAFNSGFLHGWLQGWSPQKALQYGCAMGALCVGREGGSTTPPTLAEVEMVISV